VNRLIAPVALAACLVGSLVLASCGDDPGDETAQAACQAYGQATSGGADPAALRSTAQERAQRAAEADNSYAGLRRDLEDALARAGDLADAQRTGRPIGGAQMDAYFAADEQVRADCADAGEDIGPLRP
jgi:hypothetical protein